LKRWIEHPRWRLDNSEPPRMVWDYRFVEKFEAVPDHEAAAVCVELLDGSPVYLGTETYGSSGEYMRNQMWYRHPDHEELVIGVEMKAPTIHDYAVTGKTYIHWVQDALAAAGFQLPFGWNVFSVYGAGGGITNRVYFPCLDRKGGKR